MNPSNSTLNDKIEQIRSRCAGSVGATIVRYQTAELLLTNGDWSQWPDLPIRMFLGEGSVIAISWSKFDDLWLANDFSVPFSIEDASVKWVDNSIARINPIVGATIRAIGLGRGQMAVKGEEIEIWTRLLIQVDRGWFEIFNALDENGYQFHVSQPAGEFVPCL